MTDWLRGPLAIPPPAPQRPSRPLVCCGGDDPSGNHRLVPRGVARRARNRCPRGVHAVRALRDPGDEPLRRRSLGRRDDGDDNRLRPRVPPDAGPCVGRRSRCRHDRLESRRRPVLLRRSGRVPRHARAPAGGGRVARAQAARSTAGAPPAVTRRIRVPGVRLAYADGAHLGREDPRRARARGPAFRSSGEHAQAGGASD